MKKGAVFLFFLFFIFGCIQQDRQTGEIPIPKEEMNEISPTQEQIVNATIVKEDTETPSEPAQERPPQPSTHEEPYDDGPIDLADKSSLPVLQNIGINIDNYDPKTKKAGDFEFMDTSDHYKHKLFLEFGIALESPEGPSVIPSYNYVLPLGTKIFSPVAGTIEAVRYQERDNDYEVDIIPDGFPTWRVSFDHLVNLEVQEGDKIVPGDTVGEPTSWNAFESKRGFVELQVWKATRQKPLGICPFLLLDEAIKDNIKEKIHQLVKDWENFLGRNVYDEDKWIAPGCLSEIEET